MQPYQRCDFSQNDPRWAGHMLGHATNETIGRYGCYVTAGANVARWLGKDTDPDRLNNELKARGLFVGNPRDSIGSDDFLTRIWPDIRYAGSQYWPKEVLAPMSHFNIRSDYSTEIIVMIDYDPVTPGVQMHFCRVIGLNSAWNDLEIVDSWDGRRKWLSSIAARAGKNPRMLIWKAVKYVH